MKQLLLRAAMPAVLALALAATPALAQLSGKDEGGKAGNVPGSSKPGGVELAPQGPGGSTRGITPPSAASPAPPAPAAPAPAAASKGTPAKDSGAGATK